MKKIKYILLNFIVLIIFFINNNSIYAVDTVISKESSGKIYSINSKMNQIQELDKNEIIKSIPSRYILDNKIQRRTNSYIKEDVFINNQIRTVHPNAGSLINVSNHLNFPYINVCKIKLSNGGFGTGFLVGPNLLLTAAHCFFDSSGNVLPGWICYPAYNNGVYDNLSSGWQEAVFGDWVYTGSAAGDWCVVVLDWNMGNEVGWLGCQSYANNSEMNNIIIHSIGYPGESQCYSPGNVSAVYNGFFTMTSLPISGMSGGPVLRWADDTVIGIIHKRNDDSTPYGISCRINQDIINFILSRS